MYTCVLRGGSAVPADGNAESFIGDAGDGTMEAISITDDRRGTMHGANHGAGPGPWIWGDLEQGLFVSASTPSTVPPTPTHYRTHTTPMLTSVTVRNRTHTLTTNRNGLCGGKEVQRT